MQTAVRDLAEKAAGYGIPAHIVDGNDVISCYEVSKHAADYARNGGGAVLIEAKTYRRKGHAEHDDQRYVAAGEIERGHMFTPPFGAKAEPTEAAGIQQRTDDFDPGARDGRADQ